MFVGDSSTAEPVSVKVSTQELDKDISWIELLLTNSDGKPMPGEQYDVELPDGKKITGHLDDSGRAKIDGIRAGNCKVWFPNIIHLKTI